MPIIKNTAIIVVDMQDFFLKNMKVFDREKLLTNIKVVLTQQQKIVKKIIFLEYHCRGIFHGHPLKILTDIIDQRKKLILKKKNNSGFTNTNLDEILKKDNIKKIILLGINANGCVQDTAIGAIRRGYEIITNNEIIANVYSKNLQLSSKNQKWYTTNTLPYSFPNKS